MLSSVNFAFPQDPVLPRILRRLPATQAHAVFVLNALLERKQKRNGPSFHAHIADLLHHNVHTENDLRAWLRERLAGVSVGGKSFDMARKQTDLWLREGRWVASWSHDLDLAFSPSDGLKGCPKVLFGKGKIEPEQAWAAFFNSRKSKIISPRADWLRVLRALLPPMVAHNLGVAGSLGTITYDLVTTAAEQVGARLLLVLATPLENLAAAKDSPLLDAASFPKLVVSCLTEAVNCPKPTRMVCRDRLLARVSDLHGVLELRRGGNLSRILEEQQKAHARLLWVYRPEARTLENEGNLKLLQDFSQSAVSFSETDIVAAEKSFANREMRHYPLRLLDHEGIKWQDYLYHYTRSDPGPWPGQSYRDYLEGLFNEGPLAEHTALETLVRIMVEGRIRASSRIVRGDQAVISWTSRPPSELGAIRRWNPALIRWTFAPYGLAVRRSVLRKEGAKPAVYGASAVYEKLKPSERYRFQLHEPPRCSWKIEREWRLPYDLELTGIALDDAFGFVPAISDVKAMERELRCALPIVVLPDSRFQ